MACSSRCPDPGSHTSLGECMRAKMPRVAYCNEGGGFDATRQKEWDKNLDAYQSARRQGVQPATTERRHVDAAMAASDQMGQAYEA